MKKIVSLSKDGDENMRRMYADVRKRYNAMGIFEEVYR